MAVQRLASKRSLGQTSHICLVLLFSAVVIVVYGACASVFLASRHPLGTSTDAASLSSPLPNWHDSRKLLMHMKMSHAHKHEAAGQWAAAAAGSLQERWAGFWAELPAGLEALQSLRHQLSMAKYQQLKKDLEPQETAGLDAALTNTLQQLMRQTPVEAAQAWLQNQTTAEVFRVLDTLQHPPDCTSARKLVCDLNKGCGFACQIHHVVHCFTHAVALNRTMVLKTDKWRYAPQQNGTEAWQQLMEPVSSCGMHHLSAADAKRLPAISDGNWHEQEQEVMMHAVDGRQTSLEVPAMPPDVLQLLQLFHSRPEIWWVGVLASYLLRPSALSLQRHAEYRSTHGWASPVVGVHIRRTDKISSGEAKLHSVPEYMSHVERYCDLVLPSGWQQRAQSAEPGNSRNCTIYLATDEPAVSKEIQENFPHIQVLTDPVALETGAVGARNSQGGGQGVYDDTIMLASTDYLVGTFSSQVSRLAYEVAQVNSSSSSSSSSNSTAAEPVIDRSLHYHSVDSMWYFGGMLSYEFCTTHDYTVVGGVVVEAGQHVLCSAMHSFKEGHLDCKLLSEHQNQDKPVQLPPALLGRCKSFSRNTYRNILPSYMQRPQQAAPQST